jgi:RNA polymerase sigma-70 factor (ECF subfamily)
MNDESLTDCEVVKQVQQGFPDAFDILVRRHQARMRAVVARYIADPEDVFDIVQDAFLDAFRNIATFVPERDFSPWLRTICHRRMIDYLRQRRYRYQAIQSLIDEGAHEEVVSTSGKHDNSLDQLQALKRCFAKLSQRHQDLIRLRYHHKVAVKRIAHQYDQSAVGISSLLYRIRSTLARCVQGQLAQEPE